MLTLKNKNTLVDSLNFNVTLTAISTSVVLKVIYNNYK